MITSGGRLPSGQHVISDRDLFHPHPPSRIVDDPLVDPLIATAGEHQMRLAAPSLRGRLGEQAARGRRDNEKRFLRTDLV